MAIPVKRVVQPICVRRRAGRANRSARSPLPSRSLASASSGAVAAPLGIVAYLTSAVQRRVVAAAMEDVGDFHRLADDSVGDHSTPLKRDTAQAGRQVVARAPSMRQESAAG
jgi:hypothetical protein